MGTLSLQPSRPAPQSNRTVSLEVPVACIVEQLVLVRPSSRQCIAGANKFLTREPGLRAFIANEVSYGGGPRAVAERLWALWVTGHWLELPASQRGYPPDADAAMADALGAQGPSSGASRTPRSPEPWRQRCPAVPRGGNQIALGGCDGLAANAARGAPSGAYQ